MANTERLKTIAKVRKAKREAGKARARRSLTEDQRKEAELLFDDLETLEDDLILRAIERQLERLQNATGELEKVAKKIRKDIKELEKVADYVDDAAKAIGALVKVVEAAAGI